MRSSNRFFVIFVLCLTAFSPALAQVPEISDKSEKNMTQGAADGKAAAKQQVKSAVWFGCGCLGNLLGVGIAALAVSGPRIEQLIGKPPLYVMAYTDAYKHELRSRQVRYAAYGCLIAGLAGGVGLAIACSTAEINCGDNIDCGSDGSSGTCNSYVPEASAADFE